MLWGRYKDIACGPHQLTSFCATVESLRVCSLEKMQELFNKMNNNSFVDTNSVANPAAFLPVNTPLTFPLFRPAGL